MEFAKVLPAFVNTVIQVVINKDIEYIFYKRRKKVVL